MPTLSQLPPPTPDKTGWPWTEETPQPDTMPNGSPWPRISIVTPSYNQGQFIEETIRSVLLQGYPNLEYIIIDGGSTDNSVEIIKRYEPWLTYWVSEKDRGQSHAINKGWARSTGDLLAWLNSDDIYMPNVLGQVASAAKRMPHAGIWHGILSEYSGGKDVRFVEKTVELAKLLDKAQPMGIRQPAAFFSRKVIDEVGALDERFHQFLDCDLGMRISVRFSVIFVPEHWARLRNHESAKTRRYSRTAKSYETLQLLRKFFRNPYLPVELRRKHRTTITKAYVNLVFSFLVSLTKDKEISAKGGSLI